MTYAKPKHFAAKFLRFFLAAVRTYIWIRLRSSPEKNLELFCKSGFA